MFGDGDKSCHQAKDVKTFLQEKHTSSMAWPAKNSALKLKICGEILIGVSNKVQMVQCMMIPYFPHNLVIPFSPTWSKNTIVTDNRLDFFLIRFLMPDS